MKECEKTRILPRSVILFGLAAIIAALSVLFCGCSESKSPRLTVERISLYIGESRDVLPYVEFPPSIERSVSLSCSDECVSVDGTRITGEKEGQAMLAFDISGVSATLEVVVLYLAPTKLDISAVGNTEQTVSAVSAVTPITFSAVVNSGETDVAVVWGALGATVQGASFEFTPPDYGEYIVRASLGELYDERTVRVYRPTSVTVNRFGEFEQNGNYTPVELIATEAIDPLNPRSVFEWKVNGEALGHSARFEFVPTSAGEYAISLDVNGAKVRIGQSYEVVLNASGKRAPRGEVEFDDCGGVYVCWSGGGHIVRATIVSPDGSRKNIDRADAQYSYLFKPGRLDVTDFLDVFSYTPGEYKITLVADGACETTFTQYPYEAKAYSDETVFVRNSFISGEADCERWIEELYVTGASSGLAYIGRSAGDVPTAIENKGEMLGLEISAEISENIVSVSFGEYVNAPTEHASTRVTRMYSTLPHIDYGTHSRDENYVFELDRHTAGIAVSTSEQLLYAAEYGLRPICASGSTASVIYGSAKSRLRYIIGASYSDEQKVHAIYDYLQWFTLEAANPSSTDSSRFLESVFGSATLESSSSRGSAAVTSEGVAKALLLMCSTEGIDCIIQRMEKGDGKAYFFNKVKLNGLWYNVDVFGGKIRSSELGITRPSALNAHGALLIDDASARALGLEPYGGEYAATDGGATFYLQKKNEDKYFDYYISPEEKDDYAALKAALYYAFDEKPVRAVEFPVTGGQQMYSVTTLGAELLLGSLSESEVQKIYEFIERATAEYARERFGAALGADSVTVYRVGNNIHIIVSPPRQDNET